MGSDREGGREGGREDGWREKGEVSGLGGRLKSLPAWKSATPALSSSVGRLVSSLKKVPVTPSLSIPRGHAGTDRHAWLVCGTNRGYLLLYDLRFLLLVKVGGKGAREEARGREEKSRRGAHVYVGCFFFKDFRREGKDGAMP
jgi:hypothetical protein